MFLLKSHVRAHTRTTKSGGAVQVREHEDHRPYRQNEIDHAAYQRKVKKMSDDSLRYVIQDCQAALKANPEGHKAGYYADEINYCAAELKRREGLSAASKRRLAKMHEHGVGPK